MAQRGPTPAQYKSATLEGDVPPPAPSEEEVRSQSRGRKQCIEQVEVASTMMVTKENGTIPIFFISYFLVIGFVPSLSLNLM
jgi:hypothetical protein